MNRRLYFLFPDIQHVTNAVDALHRMSIDPEDVHVYATSGVDLSTFHMADRGVILEASGKSERLLWNGNLVLFFVALLVFLLLLLLDLVLWALVPLLIMIVTVGAGIVFTSRIPNVHLDQFSDALRHGEILVMVDVPKTRVDEIEHKIHSRHPEAAIGGVSWTRSALHH